MFKWVAPLFFASRAVSLQWCTQSARSMTTRRRAVVEEAEEETFEFVVPNGVLAVYKPKGWTSADVVAKVRNTLQRAARQVEKKRRKVKVGHGGTLDPMATGVLVLGVGTGCKNLDAYLAGAKGYRAVGFLGVETDTLDAEGNATARAPWEHVTRETLESALVEFRGDIVQTPPMFSALRSKGKRLYDLARQGIEVDREARPVTVYRLELTAFDAPSFYIDVECGGGTYVRSLIADIGKRVDSVAHMAELERTRQGVFTLDDCLHQGHWTPEEIATHVVECSGRAGV
ncbi:hypothetical protein CTAYLR_006456 [Chrysophaeum taylorii]|uniref:tRNA pseudouridine(55) synthase n=1 Tax=Chrysophaeum taylorii TaxID=2483200 RepID=A0AAD7XQC8_9STRA|nr:hypothetical protein CTAYLR_006456 [Chrysophaeum taylorii]